MLLPFSWMLLHIGSNGNFLGDVFLTSSYGSVMKTTYKTTLNTFDMHFEYSQSVSIKNTVWRSKGRNQIESSRRKVTYLFIYLNKYLKNSYLMLPGPIFIFLAESR